MKQSIKVMSLCVALCSAMYIQAVPYYTARSQSVNAAREMVGWQEDINRCNEDHIYGSFSITPEYTQTFRSNRIASCIFGSDLSCSDDCGSALRIQGSLVSGRDPKAWLADYFGLPEDFDSTVTFKPRIRNFLVDLNFYMGLDELASGLYFRVHAPVVYTRWKLNPCETVNAAGTVGYQAGYFSGNPVAVSALSTSALDFFSGNAGGSNAPTLTTNNSTTSASGNSSLPATVIFNQLSCSRWANGCGDCSSSSKTRLSDVEFALGWNFWCNEDYLVGLQIRASAPTGNKPSSCYLLEPIIGSGGFWKLGGGLDFHAIFWRSECESSSFGFYLDANIQHLFDTCQKRCFDLCSSGTCKPGQNSRYMLAQRLQPVPTTAIDPLAPVNTLGVEFASEFAPVANLTTFNVDVKVSVEADIAAKFAYTNGCFGFDLGYEFYGRSCEKFCSKTNTCPANQLDGKTWALKGDSQVFGFTATTGVPVALAATQSCATIYSGLNNFASATATRLNTGIDTPVPSTNAFVAPTGAGNAVAQDSSSTPVGLTIDNVNFEGTRAISNKLFAHFNYSWRDCEDWVPYLGIGGEVEFAACGSCGSSCGSCGNSCGTSCGNSCGSTCGSTCASSCASSCGSRSGSCTRCIPNQWGVWVKGGVSFN